MNQLENLLDRPRLYCNIDGLAELGGGLMLLVTTLLLSLPANSPWHPLAWFVFVGLILVIHYGTKAIKTRITYPRTGFVEYRRDERRRASIIAAIVGALVTAGMGIALRGHSDIRTPVSLAGLVIAAAYAYRFGRAVRWKYAVACAMALGSIVIAFLPADVLAAMAHDSLASHPVRATLGGTIVISFLTYGALLLISGSLSFRLYLRQTRVVAREGE
jgi:hypothetical protein